MIKSLGLLPVLLAMVSAQGGQGNMTQQQRMAMMKQREEMMRQQQMMMAEQRRIMALAEDPDTLMDEGIKVEFAKISDESLDEKERMMSKDKMFSMISLGFMNHASYAKRLKMGEIPGVSHKDHSEFLAFFDKQIQQMTMMKARSDDMLKQMEAKIAMEPHLAELHKDHIMKAKIENKALYHSAGQTNAQKFYLEMLLTKKHKELKPTFKEYMAASSKIDRFNRKDQGATLKKFFLEGEDAVTNEEFLEPWSVVAAGIKMAKEHKPIPTPPRQEPPIYGGPSGVQPTQPGVQPVESQSSSTMYVIAALVLALLAAVAFAYKQRQASQTEEEEEDIENPKPKTKKSKSTRKSGEKSDSGKESSSSDVKKTKKSKKTKKTNESDSSSEEKKTKKSKDSKKSKDKKSKKTKKKTKTAKEVDSDSEL